MARKQLTVTKAGRAIDQLVSELQVNLPSFGIKVNEVVKGGSMGHGTTVEGDFDIDLVIYSDDVKADVINGVNKYTPYLEKLSKFFQRHFNVTEIKITRFSYQFKFDGYIDVDLLISPTFDLEHKTFFRYLNDRVGKDDRSRHWFSVCASKWQVAFMKKQESEVKQYITRAKACRNQIWPKSKGGRGRPSSFLISLLVIRAYEQSGSYTARSTTDKFKSIVQNHRSMNIYWEDYYKKEEYPSLFPQHCPRLVDPANPGNNVYLSGIGPYPANDRTQKYDIGNGDWDTFAAKIDCFDLADIQGYKRW